jgi:hypothetical protein
MNNKKYALAVVGLAVTGILLTACENMPGLRASATAPEETGTTDQPRLTRFSDIPVPSGAKMNVARSLILGPVDGWVGRLVFNAGANSQTIFQFYVREMPSFDWREITRVRAQVSILTYTRGARTATVQISTATLGGTIVSIIMAPSTKGGAPMARSPRPAPAPKPTAPLK